MNRILLFMVVLIVSFAIFNNTSFAKLLPLEEKWQEATSEYLEKLNSCEDELQKFITKNEKYMRFEEQTISLLAYQTLEAQRAYIAWFANCLYIKEKYVDSDKSEELYIDNWGKCANLVIVSQKTKSFLNQTLEKTRYDGLKKILNNAILDLNSYLESIKINKN